jgi:hypothetical protein
MVVPDNDENAKLCLCPSCPTYKKSNLSSNLFCAKERVQEKVFAAGCNCTICPVYKGHDLNQIYYCVQGKSADIKGEGSGQCVEMYSGA